MRIYYIIMVIIPSKFSSVLSTVTYPENVYISDFESFNLIHIFFFFFIIWYESNINIWLDTIIHYIRETKLNKMYIHTRFGVKKIIWGLEWNENSSSRSLKLATNKVAPTLLEYHRGVVYSTVSTWGIFKTLCTMPFRLFLSWFMIIYLQI